MSRLYKYRYIAVALSAAAVLCGAFAVTYSEWTGSRLEAVATVGTGEWETGGGESDIPVSGMGYIDSNGNYRTIDSEFGFIGYSAVFVVETSCLNQKVFFSLHGVNYGTLIFIDSTNGSVKKDGDAFVLNASGTKQDYFVTVTEFPDGNGVIEFNRANGSYDDFVVCKLL